MENTDNPALQELSQQHQLFVLEYLKDFDAVAAYARAGYKAKGQSAINSASRLLVSDGVQAALREQTEARARIAKIDGARVMQELAAVGFSNLADLMEFTATGPRLKPQDRIPEAAIRAVSSIKIRHEYGDDEKNIKPADIMEFKLWPKVEALKELAFQLIQGGKSGLTVNTVNVEMTQDERNRAIAGVLARVGTRINPAIGFGPADVSRPALEQSRTADGTSGDESRPVAERDTPQSGKAVFDLGQPADGQEPGRGCASFT